MKNRLRRPKESADQTERIRSMLYFLMFFETKILNKRPYRIASLDMSEIRGISKYGAG